MKPIVMTNEPPDLAAMRACGGSGRKLDPATRRTGRARCEECGCVFRPNTAGEVPIHQAACVGVPA